MTALFAPARDVLQQAIALMLVLDDVAYAEKLPLAFNASIGGHIRHCLDHFRSLLDGLDADEINYDARGRDARTESERLVALDVARAQLREFAALDATCLDRPIRVRARISDVHGDSPVADSTIGREVMFVVIHAIHHFALIGVMAGMLGVPLPKDLGVAPSTIKHNRDKLAA